MPRSSEGKPETYTNPVYPHSFPDPFVLKFRGEYFGYCTGDALDGKVFGVLRSKDLVNWSYIGGAMEPLASHPPFYWAPEVIYDNGKFYIYYSAGNEILMEIRVGVSDRPDGGFIDAGVCLTKEEFAIDAHIFIDDDGQRYMFYATDFLEYSHIGTGTVVDRMIDLKTLEGKPRPVTRAKYDWQVYDPARKEKGGVRWYTVEGPTVLKRKRKYFEMFSGGNWQNKSYGVSFALADSMNFTGEWEQFSDGEKILPILRTIPGKVVGPGHNSVVRGPNNRELYCVYHRWTEHGRVLAIDRMDFAGDRLFVAGPTTSEQPLPFRPMLCASELIEDLKGWTRQGDEFSSTQDDDCQISLAIPGNSFLFECTVRFVQSDSAGSFAIETGETRLEIFAGAAKAAVRCGKQMLEIGLSPDFDHSNWHLIRIEKTGNDCRVMIDNSSQTLAVKSTGDADRIQIITDGLHARISAIEVTPGFEELFESKEIPSGFRVIGAAQVSGGKLALNTRGDRREVVAACDLTFAEFEFAANLAAGNSNVEEYGLRLLPESGGAPVAQLVARPTRMAIEFTASDQRVSIDLPETFIGNEFRQFRLVHQANRLAAYLDGILLGDLGFDLSVVETVVFGAGEIEAEMIRLTAL